MDRQREAERQRLAATLSALERQEVDLAAQEAALAQTQSRGSYDKSAKGRTLGTGPTSSQLSAALRSVRQQISETQAALSNLK
jgi:hypothetical protein